MKRTSIFVTTLFVTMFASGCSSSDNTDDSSGSGSVNYTVIASGTDLNTEVADTKLTEIFSDQASLSLTSTELNIDITGADVDFATSQAILITMGVQNTGGYSIAVTSATEQNDSVTLSVLLETPGANCFLTEALTHPFQLLKVDTQKDIVVEERTATRDC